MPGSPAERAEAELVLLVRMVSIDNTDVSPNSLAKTHTLSQESVEAGSLFIASGRNLYRAEMGVGVLGWGEVE